MRDSPPSMPDGDTCGGMRRPARRIGGEGIEEGRWRRVPTSVGNRPTTTCSDCNRSCARTPHPETRWVSSACRSKRRGGLSPPGESYYPDWPGFRSKGTVSLSGRFVKRSFRFPPFLATQDPPATRSACAVRREWVGFVTSSDDNVERLALLNDQAVGERDGDAPVSEGVGGLELLAAQGDGDGSGLVALGDREGEGLEAELAEA